MSKKTVYEVAKSYKGKKKRTIYEVLQRYIKREQIGCREHMGNNNYTLRVGDHIKVINDRKGSTWNGREGTIQSFEVCDQGTKMWFIGYHGHLSGCTIQKMCPKCKKVLHEFKFKN